MTTILRLSLPAALAAILLTACGPRATDADPDAPLQVWALPAPGGSGQPGLTLAPDGRLLVSWLHSRPGQRTALQFAEYGEGMWGPAKTIAVGSRFVVNWADTPHVLATPDGALWAQWLQKVDDGGAAPHAYHVILSTSRDGGVNWSAPARVHEDDSPSEHGFAAMWPASAQDLGIAWLDGGAKHGDPQGRMQLRSRIMGAGLVSSEAAAEAIVDAAVCECCPTDAAMAGTTPVLVYRGRDAGEVRDIFVTRWQGEGWSTPARVHADGWRIEGCPVNGPAVAAAGDQVLVGWFTGADDTPSVRLALSGDGGVNFAAPREVDTGSAVLGRVDVALDGANAWVLWVRQDAQGQVLMLARFSADLSREHERVELARVGDARAAGLPKIALRNALAHVVWTDATEGGSQVRGLTYRAATAGR